MSLPQRRLSLTVVKDDDEDNDSQTLTRQRTLPLRCRGFFFFFSPPSHGPWLTASCHVVPLLPTSTASSGVTGPIPAKLGGNLQHCEHCNGIFFKGTNLLETGCICLRAKLGAAKANRDKMGPEAVQKALDDELAGKGVGAGSDGSVKKRCRDCLDVYTPGAGLSNACACLRAQSAAIRQQLVAEEGSDAEVRTGHRGGLGGWVGGRTRARRTAVCI